MRNYQLFFDGQMRKEDIAHFCDAGAIKYDGEIYCKNCNGTRIRAKLRNPYDGEISIICDRCNAELWSNKY